MDGSKPKILVVEDEVFVAWDVAQTIEDAGFAVIGPAHNLGDAIELQKNGDLAAAVLDINLGRETVWPLAEKLMREHVPFVFVTADLQHPELQTRFAHAPRLTKPLPHNALVECVRSLTSARSDQSSLKVNAR